MIETEKTIENPGNTASETETPVVDPKAAETSPIASPLIVSPSSTT